MKVKLVRKLCTVVSFLAAGTLFTATVITQANMKNISSVFGAKTFNVVNENLDEESEYYKSDYDSLSDLIEDGHNTATEVLKEGSVLLKNNNNALPLDKGSKVSLVGVTSYDPVYGGTGSGTISAADAVSFSTSLENAGLEVNPTLTENYLSEDWAQYKRGNDENFGATVLKVNEAPWSVVDKAAGDSFVQYGDAAIFTVGRVGGEGYDLNSGNNDGIDNNDGLGNDYLGLTENELSVLEGLKEKKAAGEISKIIVLINYAGMLEGSFLQDEAIDAALWVGALGIGGNAVGQLLTGEASPSGRLPDTMWMDNAMNPVNVNYGAFIYDNTDEFDVPSDVGTGMYPEATMASYVVYQEGMYLGYRYTETRYEDLVLGTQNVGDYTYNDVVAYPFGYGLSYANFELSNYSVKKSGDREYTVTVDVTNTSDRFSGKYSVPVYVSKPYGEYAKKNGIQVPSVELVNFEKTKELAPGETQTMTITLDEKFFASYDSNDAKGYVLMDGDYYVTVGGSAHDAVNNVLAAKEANGVAIQRDFMVGEGNASLATSFALNFDKDKYAYSDAVSMLDGESNALVTNLFDFADINKYEGRGDNSVEYYNRDNWSAVSFDMENGHAVVKMTEQMAKDLYAQVPDMTGQYNNTAGVPEKYQQPIPEDDGKYPAYDKNADIKLIDMRYDEEGNEISFFDPKWDEFMDQLSWEDTTNLLGNGFHVTEPVESVAKPGTKDENGPNGFGGWAFTNGYYTGTGYAYRTEKIAGHVNEDGTYTEDADPTGYATMTGFPANGIVAATFNKELANKAGQIIGEDGLWAGCSGLYGLGMNIHRSPYLGRTCEYYSECGTLTGIMGAAETKGVESKGVHVYNKHCALNDQEFTRHGICNWISEQALREIYLRGFELPITEGGAFNTMASFARFGVQSGAACGALAEDFLRGECGMRGIIVTDAYGDMNGSQNIEPYFEMVYGIYYGGSDIPDGSQPQAEEHFEKYKKNYSQMAWRMRNAAKRVLYQTAWSNAMNGMTTESEIEKIVPEWQKALFLADKIVYVLFGIFAVWTVIAVVKEEKERFAKR
ncbi:MAG: glycoside hydrolase family 3 C-terminal domain-containing protein [Lachnospiraceae bacterium]|nr:glycoside hydrolase family 3 C-terminal domain-containing protein [Lachnospiraceae bacterium]